LIRNYGLQYQPEEIHNKFYLFFIVKKELKECNAKLNERIGSLKTRFHSLQLFSSKKIVQKALCHFAIDQTIHLIQHG